MGKFFLYCDLIEIIVIAHIYLHIYIFPEFSRFSQNSSSLPEFSVRLSPKLKFAEFFNFARLVATLPGVKKSRTTEITKKTKMMPFDILIQLSSN